MRRVLTALTFMMLALAGQVLAEKEKEPPAGADLQLQTRTGKGVANGSSALDRAFHAMYDLNFQVADNELANYTTEHPNDPLGPAAQAASTLFSIFDQHKVLQSEFFASDDRYTQRPAILPDPAAVQRFESALDRAEELSKHALSQNSTDENALFTMALVYGLRADYAALVERHDLAALRFADKGSEWARKLLAISPDFCDAYVATGIEKYLVGVRPAPVRWMLRVGGIKGDQKAGLRELELAARRGRYLAPFARILLAIADLRRSKYKEAIELLGDLRQQFPHNPLFADEVARLKQNQTTSPHHTPAASGGL
ncbi:MAG TPA: hypothetical protein VEG30_13090 [Terriglobales bacterium]|nr:hypothetical protein [Terriglobales bacterium]